MWFTTESLWNMSVWDVKRAAHGITSALAEEAESELEAWRKDTKEVLLLRVCSVHRCIGALCACVHFFTTVVRREGFAAVVNVDSNYTVSVDVSAFPFAM